MGNRQQRRAKRRESRLCPLAIRSDDTYIVHMIRFEWDPAKAAVNERKHGVSLDEASTAFADPFARVIFDPDHSEEEDRFVLLGLSMVSRVLVVCHCYREGDQVIRLISARKADRHERNQYGVFQ